MKHARHCQSDLHPVRSQISLERRPNPPDSVETCRYFTGGALVPLLSRLAGLCDRCFLKSA